MRVLIIQNCATERVGLYEQYLIDHHIDYEVFHAYHGERFPQMRRYDAFIVGGTPISAYEVHRHPFLRREWRYLKNVVRADAPYFGICFGGQLLARLLGAQVRRNPRMEIGVYEVHLTSWGEKDPLLNGFPNKFPVFHWHGDAFDIPAGTRRLVKGEDCPNQLFRYKHAVAVQFHLEVTAQDAANWADQYDDESQRVHKTKAMVVAECKTHEPQMKALAYRLLGNFFAHPVKRASEQA
ncbi:MAG: type 1 glutamine amidotransferase [Candidatus Bipolaricaulia bacterium]